MYQQDPNSAYLLGVDEQNNGYSGVQSKHQQVRNASSHLQQQQQQQQQQMLHQQQQLLHGVPQHMVQQPMVHHPFGMHPQHSYDQQLLMQQQQGQQQQQQQYTNNINYNSSHAVTSGNAGFAVESSDEKADNVSMMNSEMAVVDGQGQYSLSDPRLSVFRKLHKTLAPSVLFKSWQRLGLLVAGIEAVQEHGQASLATMEKAIYDHYHGDLNHNRPIIGTARRMMDDNLRVLATEQYGITFPTEKITYENLTHSLPGSTLWRYYKELVAEVCLKINGAYRTCLTADLAVPEGKTLYDILEETLHKLWQQNEDVRRDRVRKRKSRASGGDDATGDNDDSNSEEGDAPILETIMPAVAEDGTSSAKKPRANKQALLTPKNFPGVGKFQPFSFLSFMLLGPPAGDKCWMRFALELDPGSAPRRPRLTAPFPMDTSVDGYHQQARAQSPAMLQQPQKRRRESNDEDTDAIRVFNAETAARAQRLEELKLALSLFPDDDSIKVELKQFIDSQRRTMLSPEALAAAGLPPLLK